MAAVAPISYPVQGGPHQTQFTGSACEGRNCAAASGARALRFATNNLIRLSADGFRSESGASCVPHVDSNSGGLLPSAVIRVFHRHGVQIDYGNGWNQPGIKRRSPEAVKAWLAAGNLVIALGDYGVLRPPYDQQTSFNGDHSATAADYEADANDLEWDDPIVRSGGRAPVRMPWPQFQKYCETLDDIGHTRGLLVAFVRHPVIVAGRTVRVDAGSFFIYKVAGSIAYWRGTHNTNGFEQPCSASTPKYGLGGKGDYVQVLKGSYKGVWLRRGTTGIHYPG